MTLFTLWCLLQMVVISNTYYSMYRFYQYQHKLSCCTSCTKQPNIKLPSILMLMFSQNCQMLKDVFFVGLFCISFFQSLKKVTGQLESNILCCAKPVCTCVSCLPSVCFEPLLYRSTFPYLYSAIHRKLCRMRSKLWRVVCRPFRRSLEI